MLKFSISTSHGGTDVVIDAIDSLLDEERRRFTVEKTYPGTEAQGLYKFILFLFRLFSKEAVVRCFSKNMPL